MTNGSIDFKLGQFDEFKKDVCKRLDSIEDKVDNLRTWRIKVVAFSSGISTVLWIVVSIIFKSLK